jgi:hypothetical protein
MPRSGRPSHKSGYTPLEKKYRYILAWCVFVDSKQYFIDKQLKEAESTNAPLEAYSQRPDGTWRTLEDLAATDPGTASALREWAVYVR